LLRHGASAGEHQGSIVALQVEFGSPEVLMQEGLVNGPILFEYRFDVGTVSERVGLLEEYAFDLVCGNHVRFDTSIGDYLDVGRNNAKWGKYYNDSDEGK
jgi:hypothetical protein